MNAVTRKAPAKINLGLDIVGRRADGYHLLETVFQTVSVYDCLTVSHRTQAGISLTCSVKNVPCDATNLVWKAAEAFCRAAEITPQFHIDLEKHIPSQAGMGGGSTREEPSSVNLGKAGGIPLLPAGSPVGVSAEQLQRKPGESPEEHIARITALLDAAAEAMAIAAMEHRRRLEEQKRRAKIKL